MSKQQAANPEGGGSRKQRVAEQQAAQAAAQKAARRRLFLVIGIVATITVAAIVIGVVLAMQPKKVPAGADPWGARKPEDGKPLILGDPGAKVKVRLYEDALCSHCLTFESEYGAHLTELAKDNKISYAIYPLNFQGQASNNASIGLACAAEFGFLAGMHQAVFQRAQEWDANKLADAAAQVAPDHADDLKRCVATKRYDGWVKSLTKKAVDEDKVTGTPALFINDKKIENGSFKTQAELDKLIAEASAK